MGEAKEAMSREQNRMNEILELLDKCAKLKNLADFSIYCDSLEAFNKAKQTQDAGERAVDILPKKSPKATDRNIDSHSRKRDAFHSYNIPNTVGVTRIRVKNMDEGFRGSLQGFWELLRESMANRTLCGFMDTFESSYPSATGKETHYLSARCLFISDQEQADFIAGLKPIISGMEAEIESNLTRRRMKPAPANAAAGVPAPSLHNR